MNASDVQLAHQLRKGRDEVLGMVECAVARARNVTDDVEFSPMDATRADPEFLVERRARGARGGRAHDQHPRHGRLRAAGSGARR